MPNSVRNPGLAALADAIVAARTERGLSQRALAQLLPCDPATIANIELGLRRVDVVELVVIARCLDLSPEAIIGAVAAATPSTHRFR